MSLWHLRGKNDAISKAVCNGFWGVLRRRGAQHCKLAVPRTASFSNSELSHFDVSAARALSESSIIAQMQKIQPAHAHLLSAVLMGLIYSWRVIVFRLAELEE